MRAKGLARDCPGARRWLAVRDLAFSLNRTEPVPRRRRISYAMMRVRHARRTDLDKIMTLAGRLAASVADPIPEISKTRLAADLFGPRRWGECIVAADGAGIAGYAIVSRYFEAHTGSRQLRICDLFVDE